MELVPLALDPVALASGSGLDPGEGDLDRTVEEVGPVGLEGAEGLLEEVDDLLAQIAPGPLVSAGGVGVPVAEDDPSRFQRGEDPFLEVLAAVGEHQQQLGGRIHRFGELQEELSELEPQRGAAWLPGRDDREPLAPQQLGRLVQLGRLARPLDPLERDEKTPPSFRFRDSHGRAFSHEEPWADPSVY